MLYLSSNQFLGRPSVIRPGKPVYHYVFERLVNGKFVLLSVMSSSSVHYSDSVFRATQEIAYNNKLIAVVTDTIKSCETELLALKDIKGKFSGYIQWNDPSENRARYLLRKMEESERKLETLERNNEDLKWVFLKNV